MEDAREKLDQLARSEQQCMRCDEIVACRVRALSGAGHPHAHVMVVALSPTPEEEAAGLPAGASALAALADLIPSLNNGARDRTFVTTLLKCVPRTGEAVRAPHVGEMENCFPFLANEISITTPHYVVAVGRETSAFLLEKLFRVQYGPSADPLALRVFDSPAFRVVPLAGPDELVASDEKARRGYREQLHRLASLMGL